MTEVTGRFNTALCYCETLEEAAAAQIKAVCDQEAFRDAKIRIMPDVHAGKGCTIGTTMTVTDKVVPGMVGVDIGCGMETVKVAQRNVDFRRLDKLIREQIPSGRAIRSSPHPLAAEVDLSRLRCWREINFTRASRSIGTLGGGNHFIEVDRGEDGQLYVVVHSGSRHLGTEVARYYQERARAALDDDLRRRTDALIWELRQEERFGEIEEAVRNFRASQQPIPDDLTYVEGGLFYDYLHDMKIVQHFAALNRRAMVDIIIEGMGFTRTEQFTTVHNYIDTDEMMLRKGAVSAKKGQRLLIPINMRDGSLICIGRGNEDWNCSAPHGAGRLMSRSAAMKSLSLEEYKAQMKGIYSSCVVPDTLDESPMAYKSMSEIVGLIAPTAEIIERIVPIYNFKAAE